MARDRQPHPRNLLMDHLSDPPGIVAIILGIVSIYIWKRQGTRFPASAVISIILGVLAVVLNIFWMEIFPPPQILPPIK